MKFNYETIGKKSETIQMMIIYKFFKFNFLKSGSNDLNILFENKYMYKIICLS